MLKTHAGYENDLSHNNTIYVCTNRMFWEFSMYLGCLHAFHEKHNKNPKTTPKNYTAFKLGN